MPVDRAKIEVITYSKMGAIIYFPEIHGPRASLDINIISLNTYHKYTTPKARGVLQFATVIENEHGAYIPFSSESSSENIKKLTVKEVNKHNITLLNKRRGVDLSGTSYISWNKLTEYQRPLMDQISKGDTILGIGCVLISTNSSSSQLAPSLHEPADDFQGGKRRSAPLLEAEPMALPQSLPQTKKANLSTLRYDESTTLPPLSLSPEVLNENVGYEELDVYGQESQQLPFEFMPLSLDTTVACTPPPPLSFSPEVLIENADHEEFDVYHQVPEPLVQNTRQPELIATNMSTSALARQGFFSFNASISQAHRDIAASTTQNKDLTSSTMLDNLPQSDLSGGELLKVFGEKLAQQDMHPPSSMMLDDLPQSDLSGSELLEAFGRKLA